MIPKHNQNEIIMAFQKEVDGFRTTERYFQMCRDQKLIVSEYTRKQLLEEKEMIDEYVMILNKLQEEENEGALGNVIKD